MPGAPFSTMGLSPMDEHVLERISAMEYALSTIAQRIDTLSETVERGEVNRLIDRTMIEMLAESLESADIDPSNLESDWQKRIDSLLAGDEDGAHAEHEEPAERKDRDKRSERNEPNRRNAMSVINILNKMLKPTGWANAWNRSSRLIVATIENNSLPGWSAPTNCLPRNTRLRV